MVTFTQQDLETLKEALLTGAEEVQIGDRKIKYRGQDQILAAMKMVQDYLSGVTSDISSNPSVVQAGYSRSRRCDE
jgi:hypothetical protein